ncbi:MAG: DMT family transporter, partial [Candidatus Riflebacteria bacterium]|nr:DMT family transporter [Candidatus Riflebacteria bacterium]
MTKAQKHSQPGRFLAAFYLCFTVVAFSSIETMINPIRNEIAPMLINFWRFFIGTAILLPTLIVFKQDQIRQMTRKDLRDLSLIGFLNIFLSMGAFALCVKYSKASTAAILISANPLATNFFSWLILKEKMTGKLIIALSLGLLGIIALTVRADR